MRIAHIGPSLVPVGFAYGGALERRMLELGREQARLGHRVFVFSVGGEEDYGELSIVKVQRRVAGTLGSFMYLKEAIAKAKRLNVDVMHFHSQPEAPLMGCGSAKRFLSYDFYKFRRISRGVPLRVYRRILTGFDCLLPVSDFCLRESMKHWQQPRVRVHVLYNGVNLQQFYPDPETGAKMRERLHLSDGPLLLYIGRVCEQKGTDLLVAAFQAAKQKVSALQLVIGGPIGQFHYTTMPAASPIIRLMEEAGGRYLGPIPEADLAAVYNMCDLFVMPTRQDEMFGMAAAEAQACGKPVLCSRLGGLPEVVSEGSGIYFTPGDGNHLAEGIVRFFTSVPSREIAAAARDNAQRFSWENIARSLEQIYAS